MVNNVLEESYENPFIELIKDLENIIHDYSENDKDEEENAILSSLVNIEVEHSNNVENQIKEYDDNQQKILEAKNQLERQMYIIIRIYLLDTNINILLMIYLIKLMK